MSKANKTTKVAEDKKKAAAKASAKASAKATDPKNKAKAAATASKTKEAKEKPGAKKATAKTKDDAVVKTNKNGAAKPEENKTKQKASTTRIEKLSGVQPAAADPAAPAAKQPIGFSHAGLGVKTSSKKPGLSIAPGVMILGKPAVEKTEIPTRISERRLSKKELGDIKSFLIEKRERLLAGMRRELAVQRERAESKAADEVDKATDAYDEDLSFEIATANDQELGEIQVALEKIDKGTYGECEICGCTISPSRLKILPSATTCVSCRGQEEQARRRDDSNLLFSMMSSDDDAESGDM